MARIANGSTNDDMIPNMRVQAATVAAKGFSFSHSSLRATNSDRLSAHKNELWRCGGVKLAR
jgi:hypothetical protein